MSGLLSPQLIQPQPLYHGGDTDSLTGRQMPIQIVADDPAHQWLHKGRKHADEYCASEDRIRIQS